MPQQNFNVISNKREINFVKNITSEVEGKLINGN